jgi:hypothetical protein
MGWWSAQRNDYRSPLVELANTKASVEGSSNEGIIIQPRLFRVLVYLYSGRVTFASGVIGKSTSEWKRESSVLYALVSSF